MSNEVKSIHEFDLNLICEYFLNFERQGPGSPDITLKALGFVGNLNNASRIADIGCGTGGQTMTIAKHTQAQITGLDLFPAFIKKFNDNAKKLKVQDRVKGVVGTMEDLPFQNEELDVIWSEGAIYNIGFERGLTEWKKFLKNGGYIAVTEACWLTDDRPAEIENFWLDAYPGIDTISNQVDQMKKAGYQLVANFILPENCWTEHFFAPQVEAQEHFLKKYEGNQMAFEFIANMRHEAFLYKKYSKYYGYVFYIGMKI